MSLRFRGNNLWMWTVAWSGSMAAFGTIMVLKRFGFGSDYSRIKFLSAAGEYRMLLEPGATPDNPYLPNHMRLDRYSYLDNEDTRLAFPPLYDLSMAQRDVYSSVSQMRSDRDRKDFKIRVGGLSTRTIIMTGQEEQRYVKRRLGLPKEERDKIITHVD